MLSEEQLREKIQEITEYTDHIEKLAEQYKYVNPTVCNKYKLQVSTNRNRIKAFKEVLEEDE